MTYGGTMPVNRISNFSLFTLGRGSSRVRAVVDVQADLGRWNIRFSPVLSNLVDKLTRLPEAPYTSLFSAISSLREKYSLDRPISLYIPSLEESSRIDFSKLLPDLLYREYFDSKTDTLDLRFIGNTVRKHPKIFSL